MRVRWAIFVFMGVVGIVISYLLLWQGSFSSLDTWLAITCFSFVWQSHFFFIDLTKNEPEGKQSLLPFFGPGTWLSLVRLFLISLVAGFLLSPRPAGWLSWAPFTLYLSFNLIDLFDGYAARRWGRVTRLGEKIDLDLDGRGMLVGSLLAVQFGAAGWWYLLVGLARYVYVAASRLRMRNGLPVNEKPNPHSRPLAGLQMGVTTALLAPLLSPPFTALVSTLTTIPFLLNFYFDWLVATGRMPLAKPLLAPSIARVVALVVRGVVIVLLIYRVISGTSSSPFFELFLGTGLLLGAAVRPLSLVLLIQLSLSLQNVFPTSVEIAIAISSLFLVYSGAGMLSLWAPENVLIRKRLGDQSAG